MLLISEILGPISQMHGGRGGSVEARNHGSEPALSISRPLEKIPCWRWLPRRNRTLTWAWTGADKSNGGGGSCDRGEVLVHQHLVRQAQSLLQRGRVGRGEKLSASVLHRPVRGVHLLVGGEPLVHLRECHGSPGHKLLKDIPLLLKVLLKGLVDRGVEVVLRDDVHFAPVVVHNLLDRSYECCWWIGLWRKCCSWCCWTRYKCCLFSCWGCCCSCRRS